MAARYCASCNINYPSLVQFQTCPIHGERTDMKPNRDADDDWQVQVERAQRKHDKHRDLAERTIPLVHDVSVIEEGGLFFVNQEALQRAGLRLSRMMPNQFYLFELDDGWIYETQGWDEPRRRWWVEPVAEAPDLAEELGLTGEASAA